MQLVDAVFLVHAAVTLFMTGVIWVVQVVHYPLFSFVGSRNFDRYEEAHARTITMVVLAPMVIELTTGVYLVFSRPAGLPPFLLVTGLILIAIIWMSTFFLQVPAHRILAGGFDPTAHRRLVATNWIRTICWSCRALLVLGILLGNISATR